MSVLASAKAAGKQETKGLILSGFMKGAVCPGWALEWGQSCPPPLACTSLGVVVKPHRVKCWALERGCLHWGLSNRNFAKVVL